MPNCQTCFNNVKKRIKYDASGWNDIIYVCEDCYYRLTE